METLEESEEPRLAKEGRTGPGGLTQQPKVPAVSSRGIAPGSGSRVSARPKQSDHLLFFFFSFLSFPLLLTHVYALARFPPLLCSPLLVRPCDCSGTARTQSRLSKITLPRYPHLGYSQRSAHPKCNGRASPWDYRLRDHGKNPEPGKYKEKKGPPEAHVIRGGRGAGPERYVLLSRTHAAI